MDSINHNVDEIIHKLDKNNEKFWEIKLVHASGHGWQNINHGNSKAQLTFDVNKFFEIFEIDDSKWDKFVEVFGPSKIHHDNSVVVLENQETRHAQKNKEKVLSHLRSLLREFLQGEKERIGVEIPDKIKQDIKKAGKKRLNDKKFHSKKKKNRSLDSDIIE